MLALRELELWRRKAVATSLMRIFSAASKARRYNELTRFAQVNLFSKRHTKCHGTRLSAASTGSCGKVEIAKGLPRRHWPPSFPQPFSPRGAHIKPPLPLAGFQVTIVGRIRMTAEGQPGGGGGTRMCPGHPGRAGASPEPDEPGQAARGTGSLHPLWRRLPAGKEPPRWRRYAQIRGVTYLSHPVSHHLTHAPVILSPHFRAKDLFHFP